MASDCQARAAVGALDEVFVAGAAGRGGCSGEVGAVRRRLDLDDGRFDCVVKGSLVWPTTHLGDTNSICIIFEIFDALPSL